MGELVREREENSNFFFNIYGNFTYQSVEEFCLGLIHSTCWI